MILVSTKALVKVSSEEMKTVFHFCEMLRDLEADDIGQAVEDVLKEYSSVKNRVETDNIIFKIE